MLSPLLNFVVSVTAAFALIASPATTSTIQYDNSQQTPYEKALEGWIGDLAFQESGNRATIKHLDLNGLYSYGCLQFQLATFSAFIRRYNLFPRSEDAELENLIYDCPIQKELARRMILENWNNWTHWRTSVITKVGYPPKP